MDSQSKLFAKMVGPEGNQNYVQNEAGQSGTKNSSEAAPTEDVGEVTALNNYVIRGNDEVSSQDAFKAKLKDSHKSLCTFQTFLRTLLYDELKELNIQSFNLSVFLHRR